MATGSAVAAQSNVQFSAEAVQSAPDNKSRYAQIYVGDNRVRLEYQQDKRTMVEIYDMQNQRALLLMPEQQAYMERQLPPGGIMNPMLPPKGTDPCMHMLNAQCRQLANEIMYDRPVSKWEMVVTRDGQTLRSQHWMDNERYMPLRQIWPDGTVSEMRPLGEQTLDGRVTERWELKTTRSDEQAVQSTQWYDPELKIAIREELPGGYFRELRNIRLGPQPDQLFMLPAGYRRITPQQQPAAATGSQQQAPRVQEQAPYPQQQAPYPQQQSPYPQQQAPYPQQQSPYPQQQVPYPQRQYPGR